MPSSESQPSLFNAASMLWGGITLTAVYFCQPILRGWLYDPSLRFALVSFLLWLSAVLLQWKRLPPIWLPSKTSLVTLASLLLCLGIVGELQAFIYIAVAILFSLPIGGSLFMVIVAILSSSLWMPALAWLLYPMLGDWLPWLTLLIAAILFISSLIARIIRYASKTSHTSI
ncbi:hypothetical protein SH580_03755 [Coraliomargarita algicola]|uniref:Uncharacterized protein n=1 Tax=Coraliomargarita algicola TaxID=3092156 RepID=A0ABZ0RNL4_9BACT|nr:hypothetical protein [Coraliomargarita sp. J2-16]WPJ96819.1 hypothetical protein SH580_03755 [Coraliomargarita sp. J2-16]